MKAQVKAGGLKLLVCLQQGMPRFLFLCSWLCAEKPKKSPFCRKTMFSILLFKGRHTYTLHHGTMPERWQHQRGGFNFWQQWHDWLMAFVATESKRNGRSQGGWRDVDEQTVNNITEKHMKYVLRNTIIYKQNNISEINTNNPTKNWTQEHITKHDISENTSTFQKMHQLLFCTLTGCCWPTGPPYLMEE